MQVKIALAVNLFSVSRRTARTLGREDGRLPYRTATSDPDGDILEKSAKSAHLSFSPSRRQVPASHKLALT